MVDTFVWFFASFFSSFFACFFYLLSFVISFTFLLINYMGWFLVLFISVGSACPGFDSFLIIDTTR